jgi:hypothetical protein
VHITAPSFERTTRHSRGLLGADVSVELRLSRKEMIDLFGCNENVARINEALLRLADLHLARKERRATAGRTARVWLAGGT